MAPLARFLFALLLAETASWLSISQARYGVRVEDMQQMTRYGSSLNADRSLGWLWSAARTTTDTKGLGQSITWAWDPALCTRLLPAFRSDAFGIPLIDCNTIRATMHRAFSTWSQVCMRAARARPPSCELARRAHGASTLAHCS